MFLHRSGSESLFFVVFLQVQDHEQEKLQIHGEFVGNVTAEYAGVSVGNLKKEMNNDEDTLTATQRSLIGWLFVQISLQMRVVMVFAGQLFQLLPPHAIGWPTTHGTHF